MSGRLLPDGEYDLIIRDATVRLATSKDPRLEVYSVSLTAEVISGPRARTKTTDYFQYFINSANQVGTSFPFLSYVDLVSALPMSAWDSRDAVGPAFRGLTYRVRATSKELAGGHSNEFEYVGPAVTSVTPEEEAGPAGWEEEDFSDVLAGEYEDVLPSVLMREDGAHLFYAGCVNDLHGESESGKSWIALAACLQEIARGHHVRYLDYESSRGVVVSRMMKLGAKVDDLKAYLHYYRPETRPGDTEATAKAFATLLEAESTLTVIDGVTEAMGQSGLDPMSNTDIRDWMNEVPKVLSKETGAAVVLVDHVTKSSDGRGRFAIGGQHKMAAIDGASYLVDVESGIAPGKVGSLILKVAKDRPGSVRAASGEYGRDRLQTSAVIELDSLDPGRSHMRIRTPDASRVIANAANRSLTITDALVAAFEAQDEYKSYSAIEKALSKDLELTRAEVKAGLQLLEDDGLVAITPASKPGQSTVSRWIAPRPEPVAEPLPEEDRPGWSEGPSLPDKRR